MPGSKLAPVGRLLAEYVKTSPVSGSEAVTVNCKSAPSSTALAPIGSSTGARLISFTVIVIASESLSVGVPSSVTVNVTLG